MKAPFPINPHLTAIAIAYRNSRLIADGVLPRVPVSKQEFKYRLYALADGFTLPNTQVGRTSRPNQIEFGFTEASDFTRDYALDDPIPQADLDNAPDNYDPRAKSAEYVTNLVDLDREKRVADLVFAAGTYATANKATLSGTGQWSHASSNPIKAIMDALDSMVMRPNIAVFGRATFSALIQHASIVKAFNGNSGDTGIATRQFLASLFELEEVFVGEGWLNTAKKGQTASMARVWGKHAAFIFRDSLADASRGTTFGFTAQFGDRVSGNIPDENIGMRGGEFIRVGESVKELVTATDLGYFFQNAVA